MARGGARPGAGRPRKSAVTPAPVTTKPTKKPAKTQAAPVAPSIPQDVLAPAALASMTPLDYMLMVMRDPKQDGARRDRMAMAAAPFVHIRPADAKPGKRDLQAGAAKTAVTGRFAPSAPPLKLVSGK